PPTKACDELDGIPKYHVIKFQIIAPSNAANIIFKVIVLGSTISSPIVFATDTPKINGATKLAIEAKNRALLGLIALDDIIVATRLLLS
ncbi:unnamed protein product, partial [marine sediment metagenome]